MRSTRFIAAAAAAIGLIALAVPALPAQASGTYPAVTPPPFGAKLTNESQPSNAQFGQTCDENRGIPHGSTCTWVSIQAYHNGGHELATATGTVKHLKLISCVPGSFTLQIARFNASKHTAQVVRNGPVIKYKGWPSGPGDCGGDNGDAYVIQSFPINVHVNKGDGIAIKTAGTGALYCSGGSGVLLYAPPLAPGGAMKKAPGGASCNLMVTLTYN
ncbi:MAG TPA: hypothetical protein VGO03_17135 [Acidimicrobiia bacterium]|jgi:hypothetical protein